MPDPIKFGNRAMEVKSLADAIQYCITNYIPEARKAIEAENPNHEKVVANLAATEDKIDQFLA